MDIILIPINFSLIYNHIMSLPKFRIQQKINFVNIPLPVYFSSWVCLEEIHEHVNLILKKTSKQFSSHPKTIRNMELLTVADSATTPLLFWPSVACNISKHNMFVDFKLTAIWLKPASRTVRVDDVKYLNARSKLSLKRKLIINNQITGDNEYMK